jgi:hypothetical protein
VNEYEQGPLKTPPSPLVVSDVDVPVQPVDV